MVNWLDIHYYYTDEEGGAHLCVECARKRRQTGGYAETAEMHDQTEMHEYQCEDCDRYGGEQEA